MNPSTRRHRARRAAAIIAVASVGLLAATVSSASAKIGDTNEAGAATAPLAPKTPTGGYIRVVPTARATPAGVDFENQVAPVIFPGKTDQVGSDLQVAIPNDFSSGDRVVISVFPDGSTTVAGTLGNGLNCANAAKSIGYSHAALPTLAFSGPYSSLATTWATDPSLGSGEDVGVGVNNADPLTAGTATPLPSGVVSFDSSTACAPNQVTDRLVVTLNNQSVPTTTNNNYFVITLTGIKYNVGSQVAAGPIHNVPFAQQGQSGSQFQDVPLFGGNDSQEFNDLIAGGVADNAVPGDLAGIDTNMWTNGAFVAPVSVTATSTSVIADGTTQPIGSILLTEIAADGLGDGTYTFTVLTDNACAEILTAVPTVAITGNTTAAGVAATATVALGALPCQVNVTLTGMVPSSAGTVTLSGLVGRTTVQGSLLVTITNANTAVGPTVYLTPDDQTQGGSDRFSDVNAQTTLVAPFSAAVPVPSRVGGDDRYETSSKIALNVATCTEWAVVASGTAFPDALSANYLAGSLHRQFGANVPVLLTDPGVVPPSTLAYLRTAGVKHIIIVGGNAAVSSSVQATIAGTLATRCFGFDAVDSSQPVQGQLIDVQRFSGADRYATNRAVVNAASNQFAGAVGAYVQTKFLAPAKKTAIVATGNNFADALAAGPLAYIALPLILTDGSTLSPDAASTLSANDITQVILVGGTAAVSAAVEASIQAKGITTIRLAGADRFETAAAIAYFLKSPPPGAATTGAYDGGLGFSVAPFTDVAYVANGNNFPDALSGGPLAGKFGSPIILTDATTLSANTQVFLVANKVPLKSIVVLGLGAAVSTGVLNAANAAIS